MSTPIGHTRSVAADEKAFKLAFARCLDWLQENGHAKMAIAVPTKGNLDGLISGVLGDQLVTQLQKKKVADLRGLQLYLITDRITPHGFSGPVLAAYTSPERAKYLSTWPSCKALVYVPWAEEEAADFEALVDSELIYTGEHYGKPLMG